MNAIVYERIIKEIVAELEKGERPGRSRSSGNESEFEGRSSGGNSGAS